MRCVIAVLLIGIFSWLNLPAQTGRACVAFHAGTAGAGLDYKYELNKHLSARGGFTGAVLSMSSVFETTDFHSDSKLSARFSNLHLLADYSPFRTIAGLRLVGGISYFLKAQGDLTVKPTETYYYGDIPISDEILGSVKINVSWHGFAPYAGVGIIEAVPNRKFNCNIDLGTYYLPRPKSSIAATGLLEGNETQTPVLQRNLRSFRLLPLLQINFNYKL